MRIGVIGSDGIPARYGGFETFVEQVAPHWVQLGHEVVVVGSAMGRDVATVDSQAYDSGIVCRYISLSANGASSIVYDVLSFLKIWRDVDAVLVLGVSAGLFFPVFQMLAGSRRIVVNVDGLEARRAKWTGFRKRFLAVSEDVSIRHADVVVCDNDGIRDIVDAKYKVPTVTIAYGGDHVLAIRDDQADQMLNEKFGIVPQSYALSIARIEPENNIGLMIDAFLASEHARYVLVGNFSGTEYGRQLKQTYGGERRLLFVDSLYDHRALASLRSRCKFYLHGHSVGGTNPSLVEILPYARPVLSFDCVFNRRTLKNTGGYFSGKGDLGTYLAHDDFSRYIPPVEIRSDPRFTWRQIAADYARVLA